MAKKDIVPTSEIYSLYFVKNPFRSDLNFFSFDLEAMRNTIKNSNILSWDVYEVQFFMKKPIFKKYTLAQLKKLNIR